MASRAQALAEQFAKANSDFIATVERCTDSQWKTVTAGEKWSVGVVAHHVAQGHRGIADAARMLASGQPLPHLTFEMIHQGNAEHAKQHANTTKEETLGLLCDGGAHAASVVRGLSDEQLDRSGKVLADVPPMSAQQFIERILIGHVHEHLGNIKAAIRA
jgi:DinB superfamily